MKPSAMRSMQGAKPCLANALRRPSSGAKARLHEGETLAASQSPLYAEAPPGQPQAKRRARARRREATRRESLCEAASPLAAAR